jgi:elongation factor Ts
MQKALVEANGNFDETTVILKKKGITLAEKRSGRDVNESVIQASIHPGEGVGVLLELKCETAFVAKNEAFLRLARDTCMQIAGMSPRYISPEDARGEDIAKECEIAMEQCKGKPANAIEHNIEGKLAKWYDDQQDRQKDSDQKSLPS